MVITAETSARVENGLGSLLGPATSHHRHLAGVLGGNGRRNKTRLRSRFYYDLQRFTPFNSASIARHSNFRNAGERSRGCHEGSESRLAELGSNRKNRRRVYRARDPQPGPGPAPSRRRTISADVSLLTDHGASFAEGAKVGIVIGPVLKRHGGYGFDVWAAANGLTRGFPYRQIEDAYYARNAETRASCTRPRPSRDRLSDTRRVYSEIHRVRDARHRLIGVARQSRRLATDLGMRGAIEFPPLPPLVARDRQCVSQSARARDALACAGLGIERDGTFSVSEIAMRLRA
jgi:hypothetical protein